MLLCHNAGRFPEEITAELHLVVATSRRRPEFSVTVYCVQLGRGGKRTLPSPLLAVTFHRHCCWSAVLAVKERR
nr:hypothetical protein Iba_chr03bCG3490 [Ipomoea batatas]